ncbi:maleylpyruvate isomerase family mycothiol-dependent enzyme [Lentzea sp. NPDC006480]|uniref:maleylpyruvate isomerase family mycothiol-dependent enzyme n=1 Tax=Lentzea sp. NPDC006480 TaxID=3157176 RepID=UPI0033BA6ACE
MGILSYAQRLDAGVAQTELLVAGVADADLSIPVPATPDWTLNQLLRHLGYAHRWIEQLVRERIPDADRSLSKAHSVESYAGESAALLGPWLTEGAGLLAAAMREVSPEEPIAVLFPDVPGPRFWSRRMAHETWVHRFDAFEALGLPFEVDPVVAADGLWEWMNVGLRIVALRRPEFAELLGQGGTLVFEATDVDASWHVDLTGSAPVASEGGGSGAVTVRGPAADLVLTLYRRQGPDGLDVSGDDALLKEFLGRARF